MFPQSPGDSQECLRCAEGLWPSDGTSSLPRAASLTFRKAALGWVAGLHTAGASPSGARPEPPQDKIPSLLSSQASLQPFSHLSFPDKLKPCFQILTWSVWLTGTTGDTGRMTGPVLSPV